LLYVAEVVGTMLQFFSKIVIIQIRFDVPITR